MTYHIPRQALIPPLAPGSTSGEPPPPTSEVGTAPPETSSDPAVSDPQSSTFLPSTSADSQISPVSSILPSSPFSDPTVLTPPLTSTSTSASTPTLPSATLIPPPPTISSSTTLSLSTTSSPSPLQVVSTEVTTSLSGPSSATPTSFTTIVTTLSDGSVSSTVSPLPTSLQTKSKSNPSNSPNRVGIIAGTTIAVVVFLLLLLSLIFCYRKNQLRKLWNSLDRRGARARERRGLLEDEYFDNDLTHVRARSDASVSGQGPFMSGRGSVNFSMGSTAGSPVTNNASPQFCGPAMPIANIPDSTRPYSPSRSSLPPATPSSVNSALPAIQSSRPLQNQMKTPNSSAAPNYMNYNSSVSSFPPSSPPVLSLFRPRASESGSIFREEGVWPPPNEKSSEFVDPFIGHVKKVSGDIRDELGKVVKDVMGPSRLEDSGSGPNSSPSSSPSPSQQPIFFPSPSTMTMLSPSPQSSSMMPRASSLFTPATPMTATAGGTGKATHLVGSTGLDDRSTGARGPRYNQDDSPSWKSTYQRNISTPSLSSSPELSISPLPVPPLAMANAYPKDTFMGILPQDTTGFGHRPRSSSTLPPPLPPGAAPSLIPGLSPVIPISKSTGPTSSTSAMKTSPATHAISSTTSQKSPVSAGTTNTTHTLNTEPSMTMSDASSVPYEYKDGEMTGAEEDFGWGSGSNMRSNNTRRMSNDRFEFVRGEKVDREVVGQELRAVKEEMRMLGGRPSFSPPSTRSSRLGSTSPAMVAQQMATISPSSSSLNLSPTSSPPSSHVKKPSPLKQQTIAD